MTVSEWPKSAQTVQISAGGCGEVGKRVAKAQSSIITDREPGPRDSSFFLREFGEVEFIQILQIAP